jgi:hypothetical protein
LHEPSKHESHAGETKSREVDVGEFFEFGGQKLPLKGTSGPPKERSRTAEGKPIRHDVTIAERTISAGGSSRSSKLETRVAEGGPVQHKPAPQEAALGATGRGQVIGGPVRRA